MPRKEKLYERRLRRPLDDATRQAIVSLFHERRHEIPVETELHWHPAQPRFTIRSRWVSFHGHFTPDTLVVDAELSLTARLMATDEHRGQAVRFLDAIANDLGL
jgi:hypothetical protein